jgi:hypothetical protein
MAEIMGRIYLAQKRDKLRFCGHGNGNLSSEKFGEYFNYIRNDMVFNTGL